MNKIHITGYGSMMYFICRSTFITLLLPFLIRFKQDGLVVCLLGSILGFLILQIFLFFLKKNKEEDIIVYIDKKLPFGIGIVLNILITVAILFFGFLILSKLIDFTHIQYLRDLPMIILYILFLGMLLFLAHKSFETISKACFIFLLLSLLMLFIKGIGLWGQIDITNIAPLFTHSFFEISKASISYALITTLPLILLLLVDKKNIEPQKDLYKKIKWIYVIISTILFLHFLLIITVLGPNLIALYSYPEFHLLSNVKILGFIDKLESFLSVQWIIDMMICISLCFIYAKTYAIYYVKKLFPKFYNKIENNDDHYNNQEIH